MKIFALNITCYTLFMAWGPSKHRELVYVIAWVAVVLEINCASSVGWKLVAVVRGTAEHYHCFQPTLLEQLIPNTMANHAITN